MSAAELIAFLSVTAVAAYLQTVTGFAFGLVTMAGVALTGALPLPEAAVFVGLLTVTNASQMLTTGGWKHVAKRPWIIVVLSSLPALALGYLLLEWLADTRIQALKLLLGGITMLSSLQLAFPSKGRQVAAGPLKTIIVGTVSGLMGGIFSTAGPPLVYHFYRQPLPIEVIRETLVAVFGLNAILRLALVVLAGNIPNAAYWPCLLAVPLVIAATALARRFPPPLSPPAFRRVIFCLLFVSGASLGLSALAHLIRG
jgi:uncharacterized protein